MSHLAYPLLISLPDRTAARVRIVHVVETNDKGEQVLTQLVNTPPVYELRDGTTVELDVTIPDDLIAAGWYWHGICLMWQAGGLSYGICTNLHPPPGLPGQYETCFDAARRADPQSDSGGLSGAQKQTRKAKRPKQASGSGASVSQVRALTQMELF